MPRKLLMFLMVWLLCLPAIVHSDDSNPVFAEVAGERYTISDLRDFVRKRPSLQGKLVNRIGIGEVVDEFVDAKIFRLEGERLDIPAESGLDRDSDGYYFLVQSRVVARCDAPRDAELQAYYERNPLRFASPPFVRVSRAVLAEAESIDGLRPMAFFDKVLAELDRGTLAFDELVARLEGLRAAEGRDGPRLGDLGFLQLRPVHRRTEQLELTLADAAKGSFIGPFADGGYVFLLHVTDRREPVPSGWPQARDDVEQAMMQDCRNRNFAEKRAELRERYGVAVYGEVVAEIQPITAPVRGR